MPYGRRFQGSQMFCQICLMGESLVLGQEVKMGLTYSLTYIATARETL